MWHSFEGDEGGVYTHVFYSLNVNIAHLVKFYKYQYYSMTILISYCIYSNIFSGLEVQHSVD